MKNKKVRRVIIDLVILILILLIMNLICHIKIMGKYYTSYYGETTTYDFKYSKMISLNTLYKFKVFFNKIDIFGDSYNYTLKDDQLCVIDRKEVYKCYYKTKELAYKNDQYYEISNTYFKTLANELGYYVSNNKLYGYYGKAKAITIPSNITEIAGTAFSSDFDRGVNLEKVTIPSSVKKISTSSFSYTNAKEIVIEEGVLEIDRLAFSNSQIEHIYLPVSINKIGFGILDTDFGQENLKIYCYKDSYACKFFELNKPNGNVEIVYR